VLRIQTPAGQMILGNQFGEGLTVAWNGPATTISWGSPYQGSQTTLATPTGPFIASVSPASIRIDGVEQALTGTPWAFGASLDELGVSRTLENPDGLSIGELLVYNRLLSPAELAYSEAYLRCRWQTPGCNVNTDLGPAP